MLRRVGSFIARGESPYACCVNSHGAPDAGPRPGRSAARTKASDALQTRDRRICIGPGSAVHRYALRRSTLHRIRDTLLAADFGVVLFVRNFLEPGDVGAVEGLLQRDVHHRGVGTGAVPVLFPWCDPDRVAGTDLPHRAAPERNPTHAGHDAQGLAERMGMPGRARPRFE